MGSKNGFTLISLLVVLALIGLLAVSLYGLGGKKDAGTSNGANGESQSIPARAIDKAEDVTCQSNLRQLRQGVSMYTMSGDPAPSSLADLKMDSITRCPISGKPYRYDPQTGKVWCETHPQY